MTLPENWLNHQFILGLRNPTVQNLLRDKLEMRPDMSFMQLQKMAIVMEREAEIATFACMQRSVSNRNNPFLETKKPKPQEDERTELEDLKSTLKLVCSELAQIKDRLGRNNDGAPKPWRREGRCQWEEDDNRHPRDDEGPICWVCKKKGHIARNCHGGPSRVRGELNYNAPK